MKLRFWIDLAGFVAALLLFAILWLPEIGIVAFQPFAVAIMSLELLLGIFLIMELCLQGRRRLWLIPGIAAALYGPVLLFFFLAIACRLGWAICDI